MDFSRRTFIVTAAIAPVACGLPLSYEHGTPIPQPNPTPKVRPPEIGQEWTYIKKDVFNGKTLGIINERVASIQPNITIERFEDNSVLPKEIQSSWGYVVVSPQWPKLLSFSPALPLWPQELTNSWSKQFKARYSIGGYPNGNLGWEEYMSNHGWEEITVPAGKFMALKYQTLINYENEDPNKTACIRKETAWFAPSVGRWVARETSGSYQIAGQMGVVINEGSFHWQLASYK